MVHWVYITYWSKQSYMILHLNLYHCYFVTNDLMICTVLSLQVSHEVWVLYNNKEMKVTVTKVNPDVDDLIKASGVKFKFDPKDTNAYLNRLLCSRQKLKHLNVLIDEETETPSVEMCPIQPMPQPG